MTIIAIRRDKAVAWTSFNPILDLGEMGIETDTGNFKIGTGTKHWKDLPYFGGSGAGSGTVINVDGVASANIPNLSDTTPAAVTGGLNVKWQKDGSGNISGYVPNYGIVNAQSGTSYTLGASDQGKLVTTSNASAIAVTLSSSVASSFTCFYDNLGAGTATLTPSSGTINGSANLAFTTGQGATLFFDGTNWKAVLGAGSGGVTTTGSPASGNLTKFSGASTITNGDLSGDVTTSGTLAATIPNNTVTYAKMQDTAAASVLIGRGSASGAGDPQEITLGSGLTMTGTSLSASGGGGSGGGSPMELDYVPITSSVSIAGSSGAQTTLITGSTLSYDGSTPVVISVMAFVVGGGSNTWVIEVWEDGTSLGRLGQGSGGVDSGGFFGELRRTPTAGNHQYVVKGWINGGSAYSFGAGVGGAGNGVAAFLRIERAQSTGNVVVPSVNDFRLTLASGFPIYNPFAEGVPASTDTSAETVTFSTNHGWVSGTIVTPQATSGGLTGGTRYYVNVVSATTVSFHTTVADALAGTSKVNLTSSVTSSILASGIANTTVYLSPHKGKTIALYDGSAWAYFTSAEVSIALGTLTSGLNYDVFAYNNSGTLTLELVGWSSDTARSTALVRQDGVWVKSGSTTKRYVGTIRTNSTTTTIDDKGGITTQAGGQRYVWNAANRVLQTLRVIDTAATWSYTTGTWRQANGASGNKVECVIGLTEDHFVGTVIGEVVLASNSARGAMVGIGVDLTTGPNVLALINQAFNPTGSNWVLSISSQISEPLSVGYHQIYWLEFGADVTCTFHGLAASGNSQNGLVASLFG